MCVCIQVEMFGVTANETGEESSRLLQEFVSLQKEMFSALELHYRSAHISHTHVTDTAVALMKVNSNIKTLGIPLLIYV